MPLTHVKMWNKGKWESISIEQARRLHPIGGVSASSKLFMCDLCYQPVTLTEKNIRDSYFKHSRGEDDKNCPERTFGSLNWIAKYATLQLKTKGLPIKLVVYNKSFHFELGFPALKEISLDSSSTVTILTDTNSYKFAAERFESEGISYMNVGNVPSKRYKILISRENNKELRQYWPTEVTGFTSSRLFKVSTGIMLLPTSDINFESEYYLLSIKNYSLSNRFMDIRKVCTKNKYNLYIIKPKNLNSDTARFFLEEFRLRLTSDPIQMTYLWPAVIQNQIMTYHNKQWLYVHVYGDASVMLFPTGTLDNVKLQNGQLLKIKLNDRQQMLSIGRNVNILDYSYFWYSD
ncbi:MAG: hypothetical protein IKF00_11745 [Solobacterium sp.]|nr:hypothetical protein [Solobacterium sp.]